VRRDDLSGRRPTRKASHLRVAGPRSDEPNSPVQTTAIRIGVLSDTHGYLDPAVLAHFAGVSHIIHAGDVMDTAILSALERVAPLTAVAGNLDDGELTQRLPTEASGEIAGVRFVVAHKPRRLLKRLEAGKIAVGPDGARPQLVVWGHTHVPSAAWVEGALLLNPGTASSPDEEDDGPTVAVVEVEPAGLAVRFIPLPRRVIAEVAEAEVEHPAAAVL
jgi:putative phosphoesterase